MSNQRENVRVNIPAVVILYQCRDGKKGPPIRGEMINISVGGMLMQSAEELADKNRYEIEILVSGSPLKLISNLVVLRRNQVIAAEGEVPRFEYGIEFIELDKEEQKKLYHFVQARLALSKRLEAKTKM